MNAAYVNRGGRPEAIDSRGGRPNITGDELAVP